MTTQSSDSDAAVRTPPVDVAKAAFTPGPWRTNSERGDGRLIGTDHLRVAVLPSSIEPHTPCVEATKANARLIAAAPDLLEALQSVCAQLRKRECSLADIRELDRADAAIAKAQP